MRRFTAFLILFFCFITATKSQTITGKVTDNQNNPLVGVNIVNLNTGKHSHSSLTGDFQLTQVSQGDDIQFSFIGYETQVTTVKNPSNELTIIMKAQNVDIEGIIITPGVDASSIMAEVDAENMVINSSQDVLRQVPGVVIGQHAGGGKAEQIFLRGFDIDHGTDLSISVDGLPVNMVSHAHGQGYADLHFVIPEMIEEIDYGKGPYTASVGNFATAGHLNFNTKKSFEENEIKVELGQFNTQRLVGLVNLLDDANTNALLASEFNFTDGPFESPQNFKRINLVGKFESNLSNADKIGATFSYFDSQWDASGQIPQRAINSDLINRFGAIDDTEGGTTGRKNVAFNYHRHINDKTNIKSNLFYSNYDFELFSNFTFFLNHPQDGDQIQQKEVRDLYGLTTEVERYFSSNRLSGDFRIGLELRNDLSRENQLSETKNRNEILNRIQLGEIDETNLGTYADLHLDFGKLTINPSLRYDHFNFGYKNGLSQTYSNEQVSKGIVSPKLNFLYNQNKDLQYYVKLGKGFHSNDTRVILEQTTDEILPSAYGADAGFLWKPNQDFLLHTTAWYLFSEQEFVYVGDAGIVEPSGKSERKGLEFSARYQPSEVLFLNADLNFTNARATEETDGEDYIPLAPDFIGSAGATLNLPSGLSANLSMRHVGDRPANEDNSIIAEGYTIFDLASHYDFKPFRVGFQVQNLFDVDWNETQFATESRLNFENAPVEEIHFTPGTPFFFKAVASYRF